MSVFSELFLVKTYIYNTHIIVLLLYPLITIELLYVSAVHIQLCVLPPRLPDGHVSQLILGIELLLV